MRSFFAKAVSAISLLCLNLSVKSQATTGDYQSKITGNWSIKENWERFDGINWVVAPSAPVSSDGVISIKSQHIITVDIPNILTDQIVVESGAELIIAPGSGTQFKLNNGAGDDLLVNGTMTWNSGGIYTESGASTITIASGGLLTINSSGTKILDPGLTITTNATMTWNSSDIFLSGFITNNGVVNVAGDNTISTPGSQALTNNGIINKTSSGTSTFGATINNNNGAAINLNTGTFTLSSSRVFNNNIGGILNFTSGANFFNAGIFNSNGGTIQGTGNFTNNNILNLNASLVFPATVLFATTTPGGITGIDGSGNLTINNDYIINSTINGSGALIINGNTNWQNSELYRPLTIGSGRTLTLSTSAPKILNNSNAVLTIASGGSLNWNDGQFRLGSSAIITNNGIINIVGNNQFLDNSSSCNLVNNHIISKTSTGTTNFSSIDFTNAATGILKGVGTIDFNTPGHRYHNNGTIAPGLSPGILTVNSSLNLINPFGATSNLQIEIAGNGGAGAANGHDQLQRAGNLTLDGMVTITETAPVPGGDYTIISLTTGTITGTFSSTNLPANYSIIYNSNNVISRKGTGPCTVPITNNTITTPAPSVFCGSGDPSTIAGSIPTGGDGTIFYQWQESVDDNIFTDITGATLQNFDPPILSQTTYYRRVAVAGTCTNNSASVQITINAVPVTPIISAGGPVSFCQGGNVNLTSNAASGNQWYKEGIIIGGATSQVLNVTASGSYTVKVTLSGCESAVSNVLVVTVNAIPPTPIITPGGPTVFCSGGNVNLTSNASSGNQWYKDGIAIGNATGQILLVTTGGSYTVKVIVNGCESTLSNTIVVTVNALPPTPIIIPGGPTIFCQGGNVNLSSSAASGNQWYKDGLTMGGTTTQVLNVTTSGSYTVKVTVNGCESFVSNTMVVTVNVIPPTPIITPGGPTTFCQGGNVNLISSSAHNNQWYRNGTTLFGLGQVLNVVFDGSYTVKVIENGCESMSAATVVTVNTIPPPTIISDGFNTFCQGGSVNLLSNTLAGNQWFRNGTAIVGATANILNVNTSGSYTSRVTVNGCESVVSNAIVVTVNAIPETPTITANGPITFCQGGSVNLSTNSVGNKLWYKEGVLIASGFEQQNINVSASGIYSVIVVVNGCFSTTSNIIGVIANPIPPTPNIVAGGPITFCAGGNVVLSVNFFGVNYQWFKDGIEINGAAGQSIIVTSSGSYTAKIALNGCVSATSAAVVVTVNTVPTPIINNSGPTTFCQGGNVNLTSSAATGNQWYRNNLFAGATTQVLNVTSGGSYTVRVSVNGCLSGESNPIVVNVNPSITPSINIFTQSSTVCAGALISFFAGSSGGGDTPGYQWKINGNNRGTNSSIFGTITLVNGDVVTCVMTSTLTCASPATVTSNSIIMSVYPQVIIYRDQDGDGYGNPIFHQLSCGVLPGWVLNNTDCNDNNAAIHPGAVEICNNGIDDDCDGQIDESIQATILPNGIQSICAGSTLTLSASTGTGYSYQWFRNNIVIAGQSVSTLVVNTEGVYKVRISGGNCTSTSLPVGIIILPTPIATISITGSTDICRSNSVQLSANAGILLNYQWKKNGQPIVGATQRIYTATQPGNYTVTVTNVFGCSKTSSTVTVTNSCQAPITQNKNAEGPEENILFSESLTIYPNPASDQFRVEMNFKDGKMGEAVIQLSNLSGKTVLLKKANVFKGRLQVPLQLGSQNKEGIYLLRVIFKGKVYSEKLIKINAP